MFSKADDFTILEFNQSVKHALSQSFPNKFWIRGIVKGFRQVSGRGHSYFQLSDPRGKNSSQAPAVIDCALFAGDRAKIALITGRSGIVFEIENETEVRIQAEVNFYDKNARFQIVMKDFDTSFTGDSVAVNLQRLVNQLSTEGILDENKTLPLSEIPLSIGLVTAKGSAAEKDFIKTLEESKYPFKVYVAYASMKGDQTSSSVCASFVSLLQIPLDIVVLTRGGGSVADLAWFNDEAIARTISQLPYPVISGIGHEIDTTLPDYAAHTRAKTPTHAASIIVNSVAEFDDSVSSLSNSLIAAVSPKIVLENYRINNLASGLKIHLSSIPKRKTEVIKTLVSKLNLSFTRKIHALNSELTFIENRIEVRDPKKMMKLGWSIVRDKKGLPILSSKKIKAQQTIIVSMVDGSLTATVEEKTNDS